MILVIDPELKEIVQMDPDGMMTAISGSSRIPSVLRSSAFNCSTYPICIAFPRLDVAVTSLTRPSPCPFSHFGRQAPLVEMALHPKSVSHLPHEITDNKRFRHDIVNTSVHGALDLLKARIGRDSDDVDT